jgi:hypothetical protein
MLLSCAHWPWSTGINKTNSFLSICVCVCLCVCVLYCRVTEVTDVPWVLYQSFIISNRLNLNWSRKPKILESWPVAVVSIDNVSTSKRYSHVGILWNHDFTKCAIAATFSQWSGLHYRFLIAFFSVVFFSCWSLLPNFYISPQHIFFIIIISQNVAICPKTFSDSVDSHY